MYRFFTNLGVILALFVSMAGAVPTAHAEPCTYDANQPTLTDVCTGGNICLSDRASGGICGTPPGTRAVTSGTGEVQGPLAPQNNLNPPSTPTWYGDNKIFGTIMTYVMSAFAWMLGVAMIVLDAVVLHTVVRMGDYVHNLVAIGATWTILRDLSNIVLIFGFLAIGISTILNTELLGYGKKTLPMLIIVAVFLNFSLFITGAIVDTGNLFAVQFYQQINGGHSAGDGNASSHPISDAIMEQLGLQTIYDGARANDQEVLKGNNPFLVGILGSALFMVASLVMFSIAIMLVFRFVALIFVIIIAPLGFVGYAVPQLKSVAKQWWDMLIQQTITAPVLLLMLYIALRVILDESFLNFGRGIHYFGSRAGGGVNWLGFLGVGESSDFAGFASGMIAFLVAMGLLLAVLLTAKKLSAFGSEWAIKTAGKVAFGMPAWAGRSTFGWGANKSAKYLRGTAFGRVPLVGTGLVKGLDRIASGSFDVRGTGAFKSIPYGDIDAGTAQKGGYKADLKSRVESRTKYAKELTGRNFTTDELAQQAALKKNIDENKKEIDNLNRQKSGLGNDIEGTVLDRRIKEEEKKRGDLETKRKDFEKLEEGTTKGVQLKYANALNLGMDEKSRFNTYLNFAANTEAAKKIRQEAKQSSDEKMLNSLKNALKKASEEEKPKEVGGDKSGEKH